MRHTSTIRAVRSLAAIAVFLALGVPPAYAQGGGTTAAITGVVTDTSGAVIPGATVKVKNNATGAEYEAVTSSDGSYTVPALNPGGYTVTVTLMGFKTGVLNNVRVNAGVPASANVKLEVGGLEETVVVEGGSTVIQTRRGLGYLIDA